MLQAGHLILSLCITTSTLQKLSASNCSDYEYPTWPLTCNGKTTSSRGPAYLEKADVGVVGPCEFGSRNAQVWTPDSKVHGAYMGPAWARPGPSGSHVGPIILDIWDYAYIYYNSICGLSQSLQWRHNGRDDVLNHRHIDCVLNRLFRRRSKKTSKLWVTGLREGNSPVTGKLPAQRASNAVNISIWWRHHDEDLLSRKLVSKLGRYCFR